MVDRSRVRKTELPNLVLTLGSCIPHFSEISPICTRFDLSAGDALHNWWPKKEADAQNQVQLLAKRLKATENDYASSDCCLGVLIAAIVLQFH